MHLAAAASYSPSIPRAFHANGVQYLRAIGIALLLVLAGCATPPPENTPQQNVSVLASTELDRLADIAANVEIIRDEFGVPHIYGQTDADAVFGLLYAQAEDDFPRIERNYIWAIGRLAEVEGESALYLSLIHISEPTRPY